MLAACGMHSMASSSDWMLASAARVCFGNGLSQASCIFAFKVLQNCCWLLGMLPALCG